ncbi:GLYCEROL-3-PHOSPHATE sn-2-ACYLTRANSFERASE 3 [Hibiscus trionum]|uniref:GLYCEROL-3-PHOSPHATE sn-2-ACYLTRANSFERASE 3 n=1 Tax=Hibiscus trionum TaxID=183268 RepID=A0A9W7HGV2_HIBTR|nr:GLYCEROL-3-PHOSPHATE sn-2-ACYLTRANSFERASE 3 [Hibiscus trionum]
MARIKKFFPVKVFSLVFEILLKTSRKLPYLRFKVSNGAPATQLKFLKNSSFIDEVSKQTLVFDLEGAVLKSYSPFPYFMLVTFEAGGLIRAVILLLLYPLVWLLGHELGLRVLVFVSFVGIKKEKFRAGTAILPKFFLEDVGVVVFDIVMKYERKVAVTGMPRIMVECFLRDYMGTDAVIARELKEFHGYFLGLMEEEIDAAPVINHKMSTHISGLGCFRKSHNQKILAHCKEIYLVTEAEKNTWEVLPRKRYIKQLIFHDGRLAFRPTPLKALPMFVWLPFGFLLHIIRIMVFTSVPYKFSIPLLAFSGLLNTVSTVESPVASVRSEEKLRGVLYVCNHRTLLDPIYIAIALMKSVSAVTYSLSRFSEMLSKGDLVVCPEGTTCREPYLLRFSPLFAELTDEIVPVAINLQGQIATALGFECTGLTRKDKYMILAGNAGII